MTRSREQFRALLRQALYRIKASSGKNLAVIQDELGYALGREGASYIRFLRKGNIPADPRDVRTLALELAHRGGLEAMACRRLLRSAGYAETEELMGKLFIDEPGDLPAPAAAPLSNRVYTVGPPVEQAKHFFGRTMELQRIFGWLGSLPMMHSAVIGPRRSGKTSLLHYIKNISQTSPTQLRRGQKQDWMPRPERYSWIWVDFQDVRMRRLASLLGHILNSLGLPEPDVCNLDNFMDAVTGYHWSDPVVVLMDELGAGLSAPELDQAFWWSLRSLVNAYTDGKLAFVIAAHANPMELAEEEGKTSPFFNMFNSIQLGPLTQEEANELIASSPRPFSSRDTAWILVKSGRWPCLLQILCEERLMALELEQDGEAWKAAGLRRIEPLAYLLEGNDPRKDPAR